MHSRLPLWGVAVNQDWEAVHLVSIIHPLYIKTTFFHPPLPGCSAAVAVISGFTCFMLSFIPCNLSVVSVFRNPLVCAPDLQGFSEKVLWIPQSHWNWTLNTDLLAHSLVVCNNYSLLRLASVNKQFDLQLWTTYKGLSILSSL